MALEVGPWPWSLLNVLSAAIVVGAIAVAWKSSDRVVRKNRGWTRSWRILLCVAAFSVNWIWLPVGAVYVLYRHGSAFEGVGRSSPRLERWMATHPFVTALAMFAAMVVTSSLLGVLLLHDAFSWWWARCVGYLGVSVYTVWLVRSHYRESHGRPTI